MPKVDAVYFENKRGLILNAAFDVCMEKPVSSVTMTDIIKKAGISQGGLYKYYANIDEIFVALANRMNADSTVVADVDLIVNSGQPPEVVIAGICDIAARKMRDTITGYGKISYELDGMYTAYPEREEYYRKNVIEVSDYDYLVAKLFAFIEQNVEAAYLKPVVPLHDILMFIIASFDGIRRDVILSMHYKTQDTMPSYYAFDVENLMRCLLKSTLALLKA